MEVVASLSQGRTAAAQFGLFTYKSVPVIFEPPCIIFYYIFRDAFMHVNYLSFKTHIFYKSGDYEGLCKFLKWQKINV